MERFFFVVRAMLFVFVHYGGMPAFARPLTDIGNSSHTMQAVEGDIHAVARRALLLLDDAPSLCFGQSAVSEPGLYYSSSRSIMQATTALAFSVPHMPRTAHTELHAVHAGT